MGLIGEPAELANAQAQDCAPHKTSPLAAVRVPQLGAQQLRQLGDVDRKPPRLVPSEPLHRHAPAGLVLEIDVGERISDAVRLVKPAARKECPLASESDQITAIATIRPFVPILLQKSFCTGDQKFCGS